MRLGLYKKGCFFARERRFKKTKKCIVGIFILSFVLLVSYTFFERIYPNYITRAESHANNLSIRMINKSAKEILEEKNYNEFSIIEKDAEGKVVSIEARTVEMNKFKADVISKLQENIKSSSEGYIYIPLGSLLKKEMFAGMGPKIKIKVLPTSIVEADFSDEFVSCGINQTKHKISLNVSLTMTLVSATMKKHVTTTQTLPISETIISATVPYYYGNGIISTDKNLH